MSFKAPWLREPSKPGAFRSNWDRSLLDQFVEETDPPVNELLVLAPYFDRDAEALEQLALKTRPDVIKVYLGRDVSVDGQRLVAVLDQSGTPIQACRLISPQNQHPFIHAKLIGATKNDKGWLLSGSANVSRVALLRSSTHDGGNVEAAVLSELPADRVRSAFIPPGFDTVNVDLAALESLTYAVDMPTASYPLVLRSGTRRPDSRVTVTIDGQFDGMLYLTSHAGREELVDGVTLRPFISETSVPLVWLTNVDGQTLSNRIVIDDSVQLDAWLHERSVSIERLPGFSDRDIETPIGQMLERLNRGCIFDIDETPAATRARRAFEDTEDPGFWDRFVQEELRLDPRIEHYTRLVTSRPGDDDDAFGLLRQMLDRVRERQRLRALGKASTQDTTDGTGHPWTPEQRLQTRLFNVLSRWSRALSDPRLRWVDPLAPALNYTHLLSALFESWASGYLPPHRMVLLVETLFSHVVKSQRSDGYLLAVSEDDRIKALRAITDDMRQMAAALLYAGLRPEMKPHNHVFVWQPFLIAAKALGVIAVGSETANFVASLLAATPSGLSTRVSPTAHEISKQLTWAETYINDQRWCSVLAQELGFKSIEFAHEQVSPAFDAVLKVDADIRPLSDPRLVTLIRKAIEYRRVSGIIFLLPQGRISVQLNGYVFARIEGGEYESTPRITFDQLAALERSGRSLDALVTETSREVS